MTGVIWDWNNDWSDRITDNKLYIKIKSMINC